MNTFLKLTALAAFCFASTTTLTQVGVAQDVGNLKIVNQDGKKVGAAEIKAAIGAQAGGKAQASAQAGGAAQAGGGAGGGVIINGVPQLNLNDGERIIINQSVRSVNENGEEKKTAIGKAIIIGPDGTRREIEFTPNFNGAGIVPGMIGGPRWFATPQGKSWMVGVHCSPLSDLVTSQLKMEKGTGLGVDRVHKDSPAAKGGLRQHDILLFADDRQLSSIDDLNKAVQTAGKDKASISFAILREGKEMSVSVEPEERPENQFSDMNIDFNGIRGVQPGIFEFKGMGPGMVLDFDKDAQAMADQMQKRMMEQSKRMRAEFDMIEKRLREIQQGMDRPNFDQPKKNLEEDF